MVFISWGIALFEYLLQVPANRIGFQVATAGQLKIIQEVISLSVFIPFSIFILKEPFKTNFIWVGLCLLGAVFFMFRDKPLCNRRLESAGGRLVFQSFNPKKYFL